MASKVSGMKGECVLKDSSSLTVIKISDGLGIGEGGISGTTITEGAGVHVVSQVDKTINSPDILVDVSRDDDGRLVDDDGCGDGRMVKVVMRGHELLRRSLNRAKVFGGGSTMAAADLVGSGKAGDTLLVTFRSAIDELAEKMINFGAHTADHVSGPDKCGCGAIDEAAVVVARVAECRDAIRQQFEVLGVSVDGLDEVFDNYARFAKHIAAQPFKGTEVMELIIDRGKIVKQLGGSHVEARIVLNYVQGKTLNQGLIHSLSDGTVDIFGVDVWRMQELAADLHPGDEPAERRAFQSMLAYTLAVAEVLTKGDLPVYAIKSVEQRESALAAA
ncbi:MAG TPA: hypothetical protein VGM08_00935 [Candidatus Saccharimonadales bacterium]|jgi:hypothetical protein